MADDLLVLDVRYSAELGAILKLLHALLRVGLALAGPGAQPGDLLLEGLELLLRVLADGLALLRLEHLVADGKLHHLLLADEALARPHGLGRGGILGIHRHELVRMRRGLGHAGGRLAVAVVDPGHEPDPLIRRGVGDVGSAEGAVAHHVAELLELLLDHGQIREDRLLERGLVADALLEQRDPAELVHHHQRVDLVEFGVVVAAVAQIEDDRHAIFGTGLFVLVEAGAV